ncbi:hypothetical protein [Solidesulfovibrio alcoholivorans]|uniref:hypothetical protein n=1 Tax=Solidesulfovibrio alcoholivorans TaxID=81406 RepID=UPI0004966E05|nr:hypothetical protein [Solidesulfovibrio alcoholivorans]
MTKSYLLYKCGGEGRVPLVFFTADGENEAREAPTWLKRKHPDNQGLRLGSGEFYEIIEQDLCAPQEWDAALAALGNPAPTTNSK